MKNFHKKFNKTALGIMFSVLGAAASMSALASIEDTNQHVDEEHRVEIIKGDDHEVQVYVNVDGAGTDLTLSTEILNDESQLLEYLQQLPESSRTDVFNSLTQLKDKGVVIDFDSDDQTEVKWVSDSGEENVFVIELDEAHVQGDKTHKIIKHIIKGGDNNMMKFKHAKGLSADMVTRLISKGDFSQDELNTIQQALDAKR